MQRTIGVIDALKLVLADEHHVAVVEVHVQVGLRQQALSLQSSNPLDVLKLKRQRKLMVISIFPANKCNNK